MAGRFRASLTGAGLQRLRRPPRMHFKTSSFGFAVWWIVLLLLHIVNLGYYAGAAILYRVMRFTNVDFQLMTYAIGIHPSNYYKVSTIHWIVGGFHMFFVSAMVIGSLQARRLVFRPNISPRVAQLWSRFCCRSAGMKTVSDERASLRSSITRRMSSFTDSSVAISTSIFGRDGLLGVDGIYFDHFHLARELLETTLQTIQVYRMSYLLPRVWLIRFYIVLLVANCWSTPIVHRIYARRHVQRRMVSLLCDAVLDMMSSIGVSLWIFAIYVPQYTDPVFGFPFSNWFDDMWFTNMQQEFQMMMVVSWADMASRLVFAFSLLQCIQSIKDLLSPGDLQGHEFHSERAATVAVEPVKVTAFVEQLKAVGPSDTHVQEMRQPVTAKFREWTRFVNFVLEKVGPAFFMVLGLAILVVHIVSETRGSSSDLPCRLILHPWFVNKPACSLVELDCHKLDQASGSKDSMQEAWNTFEFDATARIFVRHCPHLEIPPTIAQYNMVTSVKLYNCSLAEWSEAAAFTKMSHARMRALFLVRTNFTDGVLPPGLVTTQFPSQLVNFVTSVTNLVALPDNLHTMWPPGMTLSFELCQLQAVPSTILKMNASMLSFAGSPISTVPRQLFENPLLANVLLSYTLIQELPRVVAHPSPGLYILFLQGTNVSTFWSWMEPFVHYSYSFNKGFFNAYGTPYCSELTEIVAGNRTSFSISTTEPNARDLASLMDVSTPAKLHFAASAVVCTPGFPFYFPLGLQDATTALASHSLENGNQWFRA